MISAWILEDDFCPVFDADGGDINAKRSFEPDMGPPIERAATTASVESWQLRVAVKSDENLAAMMAWGRGTLAQWVLPFIWRHPHTGAVTKWKFLGAPRVVRIGSQSFMLSFSALRLPGVPWFAPYVPGTRARLPAWVADYDGGVYGVGDARGVAADLSALSGTYEVWKKRSSGTQGFSERTYSGDIPTSAPVGVDWLVGFAL